MALFTALIYVLSASQAVEAPVNDLLLLKRPVQYRKVDRQIAEAALPVIRWHLHMVPAASDIVVRPIQ